MGDRKLRHLAPEQFAQVIDERRAKKFAHIDDMAPEMRALVNEYGYSVVKMLLDLGVNKPSQIKHVVERILDEFSPTRGCFSVQGVRPKIVDPDSLLHPAA